MDPLERLTKPPQNQQGELQRTEVCPDCLQDLKLVRVRPGGSYKSAIVKMICQQCGYSYRKPSWIEDGIAEGIFDEFEYDDVQLFKMTSS